MAPHTTSLCCCWTSLAGHISPCLGKQILVQVERPRWGHPAQGPHDQERQASTPQPGPQKWPICPCYYGAGGSHSPKNSVLSVKGKKEEGETSLQSNNRCCVVFFLPLSGADPRTLPAPPHHLFLSAPSGGRLEASPAQLPGTGSYPSVRITIKRCIFISHKHDPLSHVWQNWVIGKHIYQTFAILQ